VDFVKSLQQATLGDPTLGLSDDALERLRNLPHMPPCNAVDKIALMAIDLYMRNPSEETYETNHAFILQYFGTDLPLYYKVKQLVSDLTGIESLVCDMCINSCLAYTGPFSELDTCPICSEPQYD
jgi:hypothetical protein